MYKRSPSFVPADSDAQPGGVNAHPNPIDDEAIGELK